MCLNAGKAIWKAGTKQLFSPGKGQITSFGLTPSVAPKEKESSVSIFLAL